MDDKIKWNMIVEQFKGSINLDFLEKKLLWINIFKLFFGYKDIQPLDCKTLSPNFNESEAFYIMHSLSGETIIMRMTDSEIRSDLKTVYYKNSPYICLTIHNKIIITIVGSSYFEENNHIVSIPFETNSQLGINFTNLISYSNFNLNKFKDFFRHQLIIENNIAEIKVQLRNPERINSILKSFFKKHYSEEEVEVAFNESFDNFSEIQGCFHLDEKIMINGGNASAKYLKNKLTDINLISSATNFTIAKINKDSKRDIKRFWANPPINYLLNDWCLALNDTIKKKIFVFIIKANTIKTEQVKTRILNSKELIDLEIIFQSDNFIDIGSKINFSKWLYYQLSY